MVRSRALLLQLYLAVNPPTISAMTAQVAYSVIHNVSCVCRSLNVEHV
jgi:hypothetical protein